MEKLRAPFLIGAIVCVALAFSIEAGAWLADLLGMDDPPGVGIPAMALVDILLLFTLGLMAASLIVPRDVVGRVQGCATVVTSCLVLLASIVVIFAALALLFLMLGLIASFFGIAVYLAVYADFPRGAAAAILAILLTLKLATGVLLLVSHQGFLQATGLLLLLATSIVLNIVVAFLHDLVPRLLVSITDAVGAIIVGIVAAIWSIALLIGGVIGVLTAIRPPSVGGEAVTR